MPVLRRFRTTFAAMLAAMWFGIGAVGAQAPTEAELAEARRTFQVGLAHADRGEWEDAVVSFRHVLEVRDAPPVLYNLGAALVALGQYPEAETLLRRVVEDTAADAALVGRATAALENMRQRGGRVTFRLVGAGPSSVVWIDGVVLPRDSLGVEVPLLAGDHVVVVREGADERHRQTVRVAVGEVLEVSLAPSGPATAEPTPADGAAAIPTSADDSARGARRRERLRNPWLWGGVAAGAALIGVVVFASVYEPPVGDPVRGNFDPPVVRF